MKYTFHHPRTVLNTILFLLLVVLTYTKSHAQQSLLEHQLQQVENYLPLFEKSNDEVSEAPVKWHLLHALKVINATYNEALSSKSANYNRASNFKWWYVSTFGKIPRGTVRAPDTMNPSFDIKKTEIISELNIVKVNLKNWDSLQKNNFYDHAILLNLNKRKLKRFLKVHTKHHLKIIRDIVER